MEYVSVPRSESDDKLNIAMSGGTAPDIVFTYDQSLFYSYASSGALNELTDAYNQYGSISRPTAAKPRISVWWGIRSMR